MNDTAFPGKRAGRARLGLAAGLAAFAGLPGLAHAGKQCEAFVVTVQNGSGQTIRTLGAGARATLTGVPAGSILRATGQFVTFEVDLDTLAVGQDVDTRTAPLPYTLTGKPADQPDDTITTTRTVVFRAKVPALGTARLNGPLDVRVGDQGSGELRIERSGGGKGMKIQAKDCSQGGIFQMEADQRLRETNVLATGFRYCY